MRESLTVLETGCRLRAEADARIEGRLRALPEGGAEVSCRAGCAACCRQLVVVSPLEAHGIAEFIAARPELAGRIAERRAAWEAEVEARPALRESLARFEAAEGYLPDAEGGALELEYWAARLPCPFLEDERCTIYPVRPFACREHHVLSHPALCAESPDAATTAGTRLEFRAVASAAGAACFELPDRLVLLPRAVEYAAERPDEAAREAAEPRVSEAIADAQRRVRLALARLLAARREARPG